MQTGVVGLPRRRWPGRLARIGALGLAALLAVFALDAATALGLFVHLMPALGVLAGGILGWWRPAFGASWFLVLGLLSVPYYGALQATSVLVAVTLPLLALSVLFAADAWQRRRTRRGEPAATV